MNKQLVISIEVKERRKEGEILTVDKLRFPLRARMRLCVQWSESSKLMYCRVKVIPAIVKKGALAGELAGFSAEDVCDEGPTV